METVTLGMTDLMVSRFAFGAWELHNDSHHAAYLADANATVATIEHERHRDDDTSYVDTIGTFINWSEVADRYAHLLRQGN